MAKNRDRESLIKLIVNTIVHEIVAEHTNRPESRNFLNSEIIEYGNRALDFAKTHGWNNEDRTYIEEESMKRIKEKLSLKYSDVKYSEQEVVKKLIKFLKEIL